MILQKSLRTIKDISRGGFVDKLAGFAARHPVDGGTFPLGCGTAIPRGAWPF